MVAFVFVLWDTASGEYPVDDSNHPFVCQHAKRIPEQNGISTSASRVSGKNNAEQPWLDTRGVFSAVSAVGCFSGTSRVADASGQEESVPAAYNGLAQWLGMAGAFFIASFILGFIAAMISQTSSGAGDSVIKLLTPAFYLAPTGFTLTEIKSFMQRRAEKRRKARAMHPER